MNWAISGPRSYWRSRASPIRTTARERCGTRRWRTSADWQFYRSSGPTLADWSLSLARTACLWRISCRSRSTVLCGGHRGDGEDSPSYLMNVRRPVHGDYQTASRILKAISANPLSAADIAERDDRVTRLVKKYREDLTAMNEWDAPKYDVPNEPNG